MSFWRRVRRRTLGTGRVRLGPEGPRPAPGPVGEDSERSLPSPTSRFVAVLCTEIVVPSSPDDTLADATYARILGDHRAMVRSVVADHEGEQIGTEGDGSLVWLASPVRAVEAACAVQREAAGRRDRGHVMAPVRIGVHAGDVIEDGDDLVGAVLDVAPLVCSAARADEIVVTEPVAERIAGCVPLLDRGRVSLGGLGEPCQLFAVGWQDVGQGGVPPEREQPPVDGD